MNGFSGKVLRGWLHIVAEPALAALTAQNIPYAVKGASASSGRGTSKTF
jgi:hypothetical protein